MPHELLDDLGTYYSKMQLMLEYVYAERYLKGDFLQIPPKEEFGETWVKAFQGEISHIEREYALTSPRDAVKWAMSTGYFKARAKKARNDAFWARTERTLLILTALLAFASVLLSLMRP